MLTQNAFAVAAQQLPAGFLQWYLVVMVLAVIVGTVADMVHKGSATYFFANMGKARARRKREVGAGELASIAMQTAAVDVLTSGEFCNPRRRLAHILTMYGFVLYVVTTVLMVFCYPAATAATPDIVPLLWWIGALMVCVGGYWFWFFIRVDVAAEGRSPFRFVQADLFVLSLVVSITLGLIWAGTGGGVGWLFGLYLLATTVLFGSVRWSKFAHMFFKPAAAGGGAGWLLGLYLLATTVLFGSVRWSKFAHMFFKPAAAFEKRVSRADGTAENLPTQTRDDPEQQKRHSMELLREAPMDMGLGIKREAPRHY